MPHRPRRQWDKGRIVGLGWTDAEQLVVVIDDGTFRLYTLHGEMKQFSLGRVRRQRHAHKLAHGPVC